MLDVVRVSLDVFDVNVAVWAGHVCIAACTRAGICTSESNATGAAASGDDNVCTCTCADGFGGEQCSTCADGFSGENCSESKLERCLDQNDLSCGC